MLSGKLILKDGSSFEGEMIGANTSVSGEVVFNTGMVGYPESLTDPSYRGQILVLTYPLIGNYGVPEDVRGPDGILKYFESEVIHVSGVIITSTDENYSHHEGSKSFEAWLKENNVPGLKGIDTRLLTQKLREKGTMLGKLVSQYDDEKKITFTDPSKKNLVEEVSIRQTISYSPIDDNRNDRNLRVILIDCGVKNNIIRSLLRRNIEVVRVPWNYDSFYEDCDFDGIVISNGPGDPKMCKETIKIIKKAMEKSIPILGICLGHQLMALAGGANTFKLKYGHRSANQPCILKGTDRGFITSQNHGYAVEEKTLGRGFKPWFINANDNTIEGLKHKSKPWISIQFHPEANPGPLDTNFLFDEFIDLMNSYH